MTRRECHYCKRKSVKVAQDERCPHCGYRTGKYHYLFTYTMFIVAIASMCAVAIGLAR